MQRVAASRGELLPALTCARIVERRERGACAGPLTSKVRPTRRESAAVSGRASA
jgi:hypothetical protein